MAKLQRARKLNKKTPKTSNQTIRKEVYNKLNNDIIPVDWDTDWDTVWFW
jgi:hypothetical protein